VGEPNWVSGAAYLPKPESNNRTNAEDSAKITVVDDLTGFKASQTKFGPALMRTELRRPKKIRSA
jgi:hypothetical protein